ncbi:MAG: hypothetical protein JXQ73_07575 [Phycisphaerae bacterium]|nr:hypothetical protein [Phycisphaerae bacterium]
MNYRADRLAVFGLIEVSVLVSTGMADPRGMTSLTNPNVHYGDVATHHVKLSRGSILARADLPPPCRPT